MAYDDTSYYGFGRAPAFRGGFQSVTMSGTLTLTTSSATFLLLDPDSSNRTVVLPAEEQTEGLFYFITNTGASNTITVTNDAAGTIQTIAALGTALIGNEDGSAWRSFSMPTTITGTMTFSGAVNCDSTLDVDTTLTGTGDAVNVTATISHATQVAEGLDVSIAQITNVRTAGTVTGIKSSVTSLSGDTAGVDYYAFEAAVTAGEAGADHIAFKLGAGFDAVLDVSSAATGEADVIVADDKASAFEIREASTTYLMVVTTNTAEAVRVDQTLDLNAKLDQDIALTGTGDAANIAATISHATQVVEGLDVSVAQITNVRTAGTVTGVKSSVTSLSGDTAGVDYYAFEAAVTAGEAAADHIAFKVGAGFDAAIDLSSCATGEPDIIIPDNVAIALQVREAANVYQTFVTTNDAERINFGKIFAGTITTIDMADAAHAIVLGTAGANETKLLGNLIFADANSSGTEAMTLPAASALSGVMLVIANTGGEDITFADVLTGLTLSTTESAWLFSNGTIWYGGVMKLT